VVNLQEASRKKGQRFRVPDWRPGRNAVPVIAVTQYVIALSAGVATINFASGNIASTKKIRAPVVVSLVLHDLPLILGNCASPPVEKHIHTTHNETMPDVQLLQIPAVRVCRHCRIRDKETDQD
jgi:hypothetical protein